MSEPAEAADKYLREIGDKLARDVEAAIPPWVERSVERIHSAWRGDVSIDVQREAAAAGRVAAEQVGRRLHELLSADLDDQRVNPLQVLREAVVYPTEVLRAAGVPEVVRDSFHERNSPNDIYGLEPAGFVDIDQGLHDLGIAWGAAKARAHLMRHRGST